MPTLTLTVGRVAGLQGSIRPPSDKSLTHRAYLLAALAEDHGFPSTVYRPLEGEDCDRTLGCLQDLGLDAERYPAGEMGERPVALIQPLASWTTPDTALYCGNSGTTMRLLVGMLAPRVGVEATLTGDESLSRRPMGRVVAPLRAMGADVSGDTAPLTVRGRPLRGIDYVSPVPSAQVKSCVLLAGLRAQGTTWVREPSPSRDHTERLLEALGVALRRRDDGAVGLDGGQSWAPFEFEVPADVSSAAFFAVGAALLPGSRVRLESVGVNPTRTGILEALEAAGVRVGVDAPTETMGEPVADILVEGAPGLRSFEVAGSLVPRLIDEIPVLAVLATQCDGVTRFRDAAELRVKETDRVETVAAGLRAMGATVTPHPDGLDVEGPVRLRGAEIDADGDHRIGMAFAIAGLVADGPTTIHNAQSIRTSYPQFERDLERLAVV